MKKIFLIFIIVILLLSSIGAVDIFDWALENILTLCLLIFIFFQKNNISNLSYLFIGLFLTLHIIGSHYAYSVPLLNYISDGFLLGRNHYDRIVHFSFGFCFTIPLLQYLQDIVGKKSYLIFGVISTFILFGFGALYEILEWLIVIMVVPELGQAFLGSQGDIWDAQKDMGLGFLGSIFILVVYGYMYNRKK